MNEQKELLQKWLRILFYIQIGYMAITAINAVTHLDSITVWVNRGLTAAVIWCLFQIKNVNPRYQKAAIAKAVAFVCGLLTLPVNTSGLGLSSTLMLVGSTASWITAYQEYHGHGEMVAEADGKLAKKWNDLFVWEIVIALGTSVFTMIGTIAMAATGVLTTTVSTVIITLSTLLGLALEGLYLIYMKRTLDLLNA